MTDTRGLPPPISSTSQAPSSAPVYASPAIKLHPAHGGYTYGTLKDVWSSHRPQGQRIVLPKLVVIAAGTILLVMLCTVPIWNALSLINDANYVFWNGRGVPAFIIGVCLATMVLYVVMVLLLFQYTDPDLLNTQTTTAILNLFLKLLGLLLMIASMPLSRQAHMTFQSLMFNCEHSPLTHRTWELAQVLQQIRQTPECMEKYSVEECTGYEEVYPYSGYLRLLEDNYFCSGFCYRQLSNSSDAPSTHGVRDVWRQASGSAFLGTEEGLSQPHHHSFSLEQLEADAGQHIYPPTLFSQAHFSLDCEGMAARDVLNFAGDVSWQCFYQGMFLVLMAVFVAFVKLVGLCTHANELEYEENEAKRVSVKKV
mmetsp:Transcript_60495/g.112317  ORF Transcript_60495/g.112317 Transcript_60495/m.112317 type:complete len:368 (+) Transcript_60495:101-1204(+)